VSICFLLSLDQRRGIDPKGGFTCPQGELYDNILDNLPKAIPTPQVEKFAELVE
jgi:hypothetical protein